MAWFACSIWQRETCLPVFGLTGLPECYDETLGSAMYVSKWSVGARPERDDPEALATGSCRLFRPTPDPLPTPSDG